jgi:predicted PhzF superfamily epimerase YddE/YHI9
MIGPLSQEELMSELKYVRLDVFTDLPFAGQHLAVFLNARDLMNPECNRLLIKIALPESTSVFAPEAPD